MKRVTFKGTGQLNGPVIINKTIEVEDSVAKSLRGQNRKDVLTAILAIHYPGVRIKPNQVVCDIIEVREEKQSKSSSEKKERRPINDNETKKSFSFFNLILWILFFPFKLSWWILKVIFKWMYKEIINNK